MSDTTQSEPVMAGSDDASDADKLAGLAEQVEHDKGGEGAAAKADELRDRMEQTEVAPEEPEGSEG